MKVTANATRSEGWWAIEIPEVEGAITQAKSLDQVAHMAADAVSIVADVDYDSVEVNVVPILDGPEGEAVRSARQLSAVAEQAQAMASASMRRVAHQLRENGLTLRDAGVVLGLSYQRVAQLLAANPAPEIEAGQVWFADSMKLFEGVEVRDCKVTSPAGFVDLVSSLGSGHAMFLIAPVEDYRTVTSDHVLPTEGAHLVGVWGI